MDLASVDRFGSSGPGSRGAIRRRKYFPRKRFAAPWEKSLTHPKEFSKSFRLETIAPITNVPTRIPRPVTEKLGCGSQPGRRRNGSPFRQVFASRLPASTAERRTFIELPFGGLPIRVSISLCELEYAETRPPMKTQLLDNPRALVFWGRTTPK